ncbi:MAG: hypothetical protein K0U16_07155 [Gammaproteobacteria bacterium]|nr:hypothetical protein [Gammaproteobacteria bacterium]
MEFRPVETLSNRELYELYHGAGVPVARKAAARRHLAERVAETMDDATQRLVFKLRYGPGYITEAELRIVRRWSGGVDVPAVFRETSSYPLRARLERFGDTVRDVLGH